MNDDIAPSSTSTATGVKLTRLRLDSLPLPAVHENDDKDSRGVVLTIGGSIHVPGAIMLSGVAALRAGAGKLQIASTRNAAAQIAVAVPEALIVSLPVSHGEIDPVAATRLLRRRLSQVDAVLIGPGMINAFKAASLVRHLLPIIPRRTTVVLDGAAIFALGDDDALLDEREGRVILTPHIGEMASLLEISADEVRANAAAVAQQCANRYQAVVVLKGGETWIAHPTLPIMNYRDGKAGLATSGSGDVLAGIVVGLAARGALPQTAAAWGVWAHGSAGNKLTRSVGKIGFLASELLPEIPRLVCD